MAILTKSKKTLLVKIENEVLSGNLSTLTDLINSQKKEKQNTMQSKTLDLIKKTIKKYGFEPIDVKEWSNTGKISIQKKNVFGEKGKIVYDFQTDTLKLSITMGNRKILSQPPREDYFAFYMDHTDSVRFKNFMSVLETELKILK